METPTSSSRIEKPEFDVRWPNGEEPPEQPNMTTPSPPQQSVRISKVLCSWVIHLAVHRRTCRQRPIKQISPPICSFAFTNLARFRFGQRKNRFPVRSCHQESQSIASSSLTSAPPIHFHSYHGKVVTTAPSILCSNHYCQCVPVPATEKCSPILLEQGIFVILGCQLRSLFIG
jgi:hypothetical protein